jgi:hypothetical protein
MKADEAARRHEGGKMPEIRCYTWIIMEAGVPDIFLQLVEGGRNVEQAFVDFSEQKTVMRNG